MKRSTRVKSWHEHLIEFGERQTRRDVPVPDSILACGGVPVDENNMECLKLTVDYNILRDLPSASGLPLYECFLT